MAFSAQPDHGQNDPKEGVLAGIRKAIPREKAKFVPNPAAKPFVPSSNVEVTRSNKTWTNSRGQDSLTQPQIHVIGGNTGNARGGPLTISTSAPMYGNGSIPNGLVDNPLILQHPVTNGVPSEEPRTPTTPQFGKHIALHLLSKVLDDETIFNFTSLDEFGANLEPFSPVSTNFPNGQGFDGTAHSWPIASNTSHIHPPPPPEASLPGVVTNFGSLPGQNIWSNESYHGNTPPLSPLEISPLSTSSIKSPDIGGAYLKNPIRPTSLPSYERNSPMVNGYAEDHSPYPSPTGQSYGSSDAFPRHSFLPIQEPYTNGRSQQSCESGYYSNSNNGSCYGVPMSPSSVMGYMPSPPELHTFILPLSGPSSQYSSPSMSPSSPPITFMSKQMVSPDAESVGSPKAHQHGMRDKSFPSPSPRDRRENGYVSHGTPQRKSPLMSELHMRLDKCYEQLRLLEKERKKAEAEISDLWSGRRLSISSNGSSLRVPPNPSRVDKMIVDQLREHSKVESLVSRIERIRHSPQHVSISEAIEQWQQCIQELRARRQEEISSSGSGGGRSRLCSISRYQTDTADLQALVLAVKELSAQTRVARTTLWCAVHLVTTDMQPRSLTDCDSSCASSMDSPRALEGTGGVS